MNWTATISVALGVVLVAAAYFLGRSNGYRRGHFRGVMDENARMRGMLNASEKTAEERLDVVSELSDLTVGECRDILRGNPPKRLVGPVPEEVWGRVLADSITERSPSYFLDELRTGVTDWAAVEAHNARLRPEGV